MPIQYALHLPLAPSFSADNFFLSDCNRQAHAQVMAWPRWPGHALLLCGAAGSGKTHLARLWKEISDAVALSPEALLEQEWRQHALIENIDAIAGEEALLHAYNATKGRGVSLLLTSRLALTELPFALPDLTSRLRALPVAQIGPPDDALLASVLRKQFADRQLKVEEEVIAYLIARMERSLGAAQALAAQLDHDAIAEHKPLTVPFVKRVLGY